MSESETDEAAVRSLYTQLTDAWNRGNGADFAAGFADDGDLVAFDGTHYTGREQIAVVHQDLFDKWMKGTRLVGTVEQVRFLGPDVAVMHAIGNTIARGKSKPNRARASIQTLVATRVTGGPADDAGAVAGHWRLAAFQNSRIRPIGRGALTFLVWTVGDLIWRVLRLSTDPSPTGAAAGGSRDG
ncbi:MAG: SgcJ/EcaC family oxidoreductase [Acidimicrobiales bacterium]